MNGSVDFTVPSLFSFTTTTSPPAFLVRFHEPWRATKIAFLILRREHLAGVEPHAERGGVRAHQGDRLHELVARVAPAELRIGKSPWWQNG